MIPKLHLPSPKKIANKIKDVVAPRGPDQNRRNLIKESARGVRNFGRQAYWRVNPPTAEYIGDDTVERQTAKVLNPIDDDTVDSKTAKVLKLIRKGSKNAQIRFYEDLQASGAFKSIKDGHQEMVGAVVRRLRATGELPAVENEISCLEQYWTPANQEKLDNMEPRAVFDFMCGCLHAQFLLASKWLPHDKAGAQDALEKSLAALDNVEAAFNTLAAQNWSHGYVRFHADKPMGEALVTFRNKYEHYLDLVDDLPSSNQPPSDDATVDLNGYR